MLNISQGVDIKLDTGIHITHSCNISISYL